MNLQKQKSLTYEIASEPKQSRKTTPTNEIIPSLFLLSVSCRQGTWDSPTFSPRKWFLYASSLFIFSVSLLIPVFCQRRTWNSSTSLRRTIEPLPELPWLPPSLVHLLERARKPQRATWSLWLDRLCSSRSHRPMCCSLRHCSRRSSRLALEVPDLNTTSCLRSRELRRTISWLFSWKRRKRFGGLSQAGSLVVGALLGVASRQWSRG